VAGVEHVGEFFGKQAEEARRRHTTMLLGEFVVELKQIAGEKKISGSLGLVELEIVIECDIRETCQYIAQNIIQARNQVTNVFTALDRDEFMTLDGKKRIKKALM
jgi:flagellar basal body-associated protein FliL